MGIRKTQSKTVKKKPMARDESRRVFGIAGAHAFHELISQIEVGIRIAEEEPERHFDEAVMDRGPQFKHGMQIRYITGAEYDAYFAREQEAYTRVVKDAKEAYIEKLNIAAEWVRLAKNEQVANLIKEEIIKVDTIIPYEQPLLLAFSLKKVLQDDAARSADLTPVNLDADARDYIRKGLLQFAARINIEAESIEQSIPLNECPPTLTFESLRKLVTNIGCRPIAELLTTADTNTSRITQFIIPRCIDLLGADPISSPIQATLSASNPLADSDPPPALSGSRFEISKDFSKVFDKKENKHYTFDNDVTAIALAFMSEQCRSKAQRKKGIEIVRAVHARYFEKHNTKCDGYNSVGEFFRVSKGGGSNLKVALPFYGTLVMNNGRAGMYWMELDDV